MYDRPKGIENTRIWVDGCFDFTHHGHAGAMMQARQLGKELYVGVHSDEEILKNKGPTVMKLDERMKSVEGCKWATKAIANAPYVTDPEFLKKYDCPYVVHGDDITTDANGEDCYKTVKDLGMFVVVKRTPNISTTDLVGRMLLGNKDHHLPLIKSIDNELFSPDNITRFGKYATDKTGLNPHSGVFVNIHDKPLFTIVEPSQEMSKKYEKSVYIDGGFDLFHPGHIEVLRLTKEYADSIGAVVVVGIHEDKVINQNSELNYPIMTIFERSLCVLQCKYVDGVILGAPFKPTKVFLDKFAGNIVNVFHGPTTIKPDVYQDLQPGMLKTIDEHKYSHINTKFIVNRVLSNVEAYEERQRKKGWKAENEKRLKEEEDAKR